MNRRNSLSALLGQKESATPPSASIPEINENSVIQKAKATVMVTSGLEPYTGEWTFQCAGHLLRRTSFGPDYNQIKAAFEGGLNDTLGQVLTNPPVDTDPVNYEYDNDPFVPIGESWKDREYPDPAAVGMMVTNQIRGYRRASFVLWQLSLLMENTISIREKMALFWHNHFPIAGNEDARYGYQYAQTLRTFALGNFRELTKAITIDPAMLRYLNGRQNTRFAPNENYARELLELFTIGKGPLAGPGNYTNFTEEDVAAAAKILTGWRDFGRYCLDDDADNTCEVGAFFTLNRHDTSDKTLSPELGGVTISDQGEDEYKVLINTIFQQDECARFICRKLYRFFVYYEINESVEANIIQPIAEILIDNDYEVQPVLDALFRSAHFYDPDLMGCHIKNPLDYVTGILKQTGVAVPSDVLTAYRTMGNIHFTAALLQMQYYNPPSVSGWPAYYQAPSYYQLWINSVTLPFRIGTVFSILFLGMEVKDDDNNLLETLQIDPLAFVNNFDQPEEIDPLIDDMVAVLFARPVSPGQKDILKQILIPGLPDFEWNTEYSIYLSDPNNEEVANSVRGKLRNLMWAMMNMPEFQLS